MSEPLQFKIEVFEGPRELLLHLISKHKLNINDIPIAQLLEQYLDYLAQMQSMDLEITSEFLAMAAQLVYIKTVSLLPRHEEAEELKKQLQGQLLQYDLCQRIAKQMGAKYQGNAVFVRTPLPIPVDTVYRRSHHPQELLDAYLDSAGKAQRRLPPPKTAFSGIVNKRMVSVGSRIIYVMRRLYQDGQLPYKELFAPCDRSELVATFLAMLELMKSRRITVSDDNTMVYFNRTHFTGEEAPSEEPGGKEEG